MRYAVEVRGLRKTYVSGWPKRKKTDVLKGISLSVPEGAFWGLLGPNGAGKTTLLSILSNLLTPEEGVVFVLGKDIRTQAADICRRINLSSGHANFLWSMSVKENLQYYAMLYGLSGKSRGRKVDSLLEILDLGAFSHTRFDELSTGTKQRLSLAKALVNDPELLLLDEPTVGLDPDVALRIRETVQRLHHDKGSTILMTTHNMKEAETLCQQVAFIKEGSIRACGRPRELKHGLGLGDLVTLRFSGKLPVDSLNGMEGVLGLQEGEDSCRILLDDHQKRLAGILTSLHDRGITVNDLQIQESGLEDVFIAFTK